MLSVSIQTRSNLVSSGGDAISSISVHVGLDNKELSHLPLKRERKQWAHSYVC